MTKPTLTRRAFALAALALALPARARALTQPDAEAFVGAVVAELRALAEARQGGAEGAAAFLAVVERRSAMAAVAQFALARAWREATEAQRTAYLAVFRDYVGRTYQKRFGEYAGETVAITGSLDAGKKGVLVTSVLTRPAGAPVAVDWLVSDRTGAPLLSDIIFEGVSLAVTLRETFGGMLEARKGDIDLFIADLAASDGA